MNWMQNCLVLAGLLSASLAWADDQDDKKPGKGKGKEEAKPTVIQIDLSKLPPDLAKQLKKYAGAGKAEKSPPPQVEPPKKDKPKKSAVTQGKGKTPQVQLPPGLAKKPANHPGVIHYIQHALGKMAPAPRNKAKDKG